jgi:TPR repeat protein
MSDSESIVAAPLQSQALFPVLSTRCVRCATDLSRLPGDARYCPRCGLDSWDSLPPARPAKVDEGSESFGQLEAELQHLAEVAGSAGVLVSFSAVPIPEASSEILRGYGNALYKLGRRYEIGSGTPKNQAEAERCYRKAARLGNLVAFARLAVNCVKQHDYSNCPTFVLPPNGPEDTGH